MEIPIELHDKWLTQRW